MKVGDSMECFKWLEKVLKVTWQRSYKVYESGPIFIPSGGKIKMYVKLINGYWECGALLCEGRFPITIKISSKGGSIISEQDCVFKLYQNYGEGSKDIEISIPFNDQYKLIIEVNTQKSYNAKATIKLDAEICK